MPQPSLTITHLKTSKQVEKMDVIHRHWFQWSDRKNLSNVVVRIELLNADGTVHTTVSVKLQKTRITGHAPAADGSGSKPVYDQPVFIQIDDVPEVRPTHFRYYTVSGVLTKSEKVTAEMAGIYEDITVYG